MVALLQSEPQLLAKLHENARLAHARLAKMRGLVLGHCDATSPVLHLRLADNLASSDYITNQHLLQRIADAAADHGVAVAVSKYIRNHPRPRLPPASLRVAISALHTREHIDQLGRALEVSVFVACFACVHFSSLPLLTLPAPRCNSQAAVSAVTRSA